MDVSHELGALRFVVDSPLSSKVAMFNQQVNQHKQSQLLNPFSQVDGRSSPKPTFSKDDYGKPLAGSLTEMRGQKANIHVLKEMLELCQIIDSEGYNVKDESTMRVIPFGELFNIYNYISDKVVGILLRARKHKLVEFEGEMLFQRRDDDVPIFLLKPIQEIRRELEDKIESVKRAGSASPQATSVLLDKRAQGLSVPRGATPRSSVSRTPSPQSSKAGTPVRDTKAKPAPATVVVAEIPKTEEAIKTEVLENKPAQAPTAETSVQQTPQTPEVKEGTKTTDVAVQEQQSALVESPESADATIPTEVAAQEQQPVPVVPTANTEATTSTEILVQEQPSATAEVSENTNAIPSAVSEIKTDVNNNSKNSDLPTITIEATAVYESPAKIEDASETSNTTTIIPDSESESAVPSNAPTNTADNI